MSRVGKKPIILPSGVEAEISKGEIVIKGPKGSLNLKLHPVVKVAKENGLLNVSVEYQEEKKNRALWGLFGSLIKNMVDGVLNGYEKKLEMSGIGFKAEVRGRELVLDIGFSHQVKFNIPVGIEISVEKENISVRGIDKGLVGEAAARIRSFKKPEPYKGKGIRYVGEKIRRKSGKATVKAAA